MKSPGFCLQLYKNIEQIIKLKFYLLCAAVLAHKQGKNPMILWIHSNDE